MLRDLVRRIGRWAFPPPDPNARQHPDGGPGAWHGPYPWETADDALARVPAEAELARLMYGNAFLTEEADGRLVLVDPPPPSDDEMLRRLLAGRAPYTPDEAREYEHRRPPRSQWDGVAEAFADVDRARRRAG